MYLMIDNYDSFVYNIVCYMEELGEKVALVRNDKISVGEIEDLLSLKKIEGLIISPGPKTLMTVGTAKKLLIKWRAEFQS